MLKLVDEFRSDALNPFDDTGEICDALNNLAQKYQMSPGDSYWIGEATTTLLGMELALAVQKNIAENK